MIDDNITWEIRNGEVVFWDDPRLRNKPLDHYKEFQECIEWANTRQSTMVKDYISEFDNGKVWSIILAPSQEINAKVGRIKQELQTKPLGFPNRPDIPLSKDDKRGRYTIASRYQVLLGTLPQKDPNFWKRIWLKGLTPKISFFMRVEAQN